MTRFFLRSRQNVDEAELEAFAAQLFAALRSTAPSPRSIERARATLAARLHAQAEPQVAGFGYLRRALAGGVALLPLAVAGSVAAAVSGNDFGPFELSRLPGFFATSGKHQSVGSLAVETEEGSDPETSTPSTPPESSSPRGGEELSPVGSQGIGSEVCVEANAHAQDVLEGLLDGDELDADGKAGVTHALESLGSCGNQRDGSDNGDAGPPFDVPRGGPPAGVLPGPPDDVPGGPPEGVPMGRPESVPVGPPQAVPAGPPTDVPRGRSSQAASPSAAAGDGDDGGTSASPSVLPGVARPAASDAALNGPFAGGDKLSATPRGVAGPGR